MATTAAKASDKVHECTPAEGRALLEEAAQRHLKLSASEFIAKWDAGEFDDDPDGPEVVKVAMLIPFGR